MRVIGVKILVKNLIPSGVDVGGQERTDVSAQSRANLLFLHLFIQFSPLMDWMIPATFKGADLLYSVC